jgi:pimeloyl-ACP methyl ester carboxylesterase
LKTEINSEELWEKSIGKEVKDLKINYKSFGESTNEAYPLILLHGWSNSLEVVLPLAENLGKYFKVYALDLPGHGKSEIPQEIWDMKGFACVVKKFLDDNQIPKANFVGHSFGGKTIIKFNYLFPNYINLNVLIGSSGFRPKPKFKKKMYFLFLKYLRNLIRFKNTSLGKKLYENWYIPKFASRDYLNAGSMTRTFVKTLNEELYEELESINSRTLLIWGEKDDESPPQIGEKMNKLIKNSKLIILEGKDHFPFLGSGLPLITKYIRDFLIKEQVF